MLLVISGPIASGKSTTARAVARELGRGGVTAAVIDVDLLYETLEHDGRHKNDPAKWLRAQRAAAALAEAFLGDGVEIVIVDGDFVRESERAVLRTALSASVSPCFVTLRVSYDEALRRATGDPTRGISRDAAFLRKYYDAVSVALAEPPATDLVLDSESLTVSAAARMIVDWARAEPRSSTLGT